MVTCCAVGCSNSSLKGKFKLYRLPMGKGKHDKNRLKIWLERIGREKWIPTNHSRLCEVHFTEDQFEANRADNRRLLKYNAVPSIFTHPPLEKVTLNWMRHRLQGVYLKLKPGTLPYKFDCQKGSNPPQSTKHLLEEHLSEESTSALLSPVDESLKKRRKIKAKSENRKIIGPESNLLLATMTSSDRVVKSDPFTVTKSEPGPATRIKLDTTMMEQHVHMAMTCKIFPADESQPDSLSKIKEEPTDPDTYKEDILSASVTQELRHFSKEPSKSPNRECSLFHPPVLIKEEPISFEEEY